MITKIERKKLNEAKYFASLQSAENYKIYAEIHYLDALTEGKWFCYSWNDYEAIMPVCFDSKFLLKRVVQPYFCQQLGVFYSSRISKEVFQAFYEELKSNRVKNYQFNDDNSAHFEFKGKKRKNYILDLQRPYEKIAKKYGSNAKRNLKKIGDDLEFILIDQPIEKHIEQYLSLKKENSEHLKEKVFQTLERLLRELQKEAQLKMAFVIHDRKFISGACFSVKNAQLYYTNGVSNSIAKEKNASFLLFDECLKRWAENYDILDFEGSMNRGIERFFKGWGAEKTMYKRI